MKLNEVKSILNKTKNPQYWFFVEYNFNAYRGCTHGCIYCDSRSLCYGIDDFTDVIVKSNAVSLLERELKVKKNKFMLGTGSMSDPYNHCEAKLNITRDMLKVINKYQHGINIVTKSDLILRDLAILKEINQKAFVSVAITITTCDNNIAKNIEPNVTLPTERLKILKKLSDAGIYCGVLMMPILPFILDNEDNITNIVKNVAINGGKFIIPSFGVTLRDRQREYYYKQLANINYSILQNYYHFYNNSYSCVSFKHKELYQKFVSLCKEYNIIYQMEKVKRFVSKEPISLFNFENYERNEL